MQREDSGSPTSGSGSAGEIQHHFIQEMSGHIEQLIHCCNGVDEELTTACTRFQLEHAASQAAYSQEQEQAKSEKRSMTRAFQADQLRSAFNRTADFAVTVARHVLRRSVEHHRSAPIAETATPATSSSSNNVRGGTSPLSTGPMGSFNTDTLDDQILRHHQWNRSSSVDDMGEGTHHWIETGANAMHAAIQCLITLLVAHNGKAVRNETQNHLLVENKLAEYISDALSIDRDVELSCFAEGYRTMHVNLLANFTHDNERVARIVGSNNRLMYHLLQCARIDEENPGSCEWAELTIGNICFLSPEAREFVKGLKRVNSEQGTSRSLATQLGGSASASVASDTASNSSGHSPRDTSVPPPPSQSF